MNDFEEFQRLKEQFKIFLEKQGVKKSSPNITLWFLSEQELNQLPKITKEDIINRKAPVRISIRKVSENGYTHEIRYRTNGYNVYISDKNLERGQKRFLEKFKKAKKRINNTTLAPQTFHSFVMYYF